MNNTNTSNRPSKCTLMRRIMELGFYIDDIGLYLDTHPDDCRSLARYHEYTMNMTPPFRIMPNGTVPSTNIT